MQIPPVNPSSYQNNRDWALSNKQKGLVATCFSLGSTLSGVVKAFSNKESETYKNSNFLEKVFYAISNSLQYFLFGRKDDVLGDDEEKRLFAAKIGKVATFQEKYINPFAKLATLALDTNHQDGLSDLLSWFDVAYWRIRFASLKVNWKDFKKVPKILKQLSNPELDAAQKERRTQNIAEIIYPFLGLVGSVVVSTFTPIKTILKFFSIENKTLNFFTSLGQSCIQHIMYFFKFTLPLLWKGYIKNDKKSYAVFVVGAASDLINATSPIVELLPENRFLNFFSKIWKSLANNLSSLFFALRRNYLGNDWINTHPEN